MRPSVIHQFHGGSRYGDGVTNGMLFIRRLLRQAGYRSEIYCAHVDPLLAGEILPLDQFENAPDAITFIHYSHGHDFHDWIERVRGPRFLVYHNITPAHFFAAENPLGHYSTIGREQVQKWARSGFFSGTIADSEYNAAELREYGYPSVTTIPLLVDLESIRSRAFEPDLTARENEVRTLLFVGRWSESKGQLDLVRMMKGLVRSGTRPVRLVLAGDTISADYKDLVFRAIEEAGLSERVVVRDFPRTEEVLGLYRQADAYVSFSRHEGFGMPLVEAMAFGVPVVALAAAAIPDTMGAGGILLQDDDPDVFAAAVKLLLEEPWLRREVVQAQNAELRRFETATLVKSLKKCLSESGMDVPLNIPVSIGGSQTWQVEGPFDSTYSLAVLNRELARTFVAAGLPATLKWVDTLGPYRPDAGFLDANPDVAGMWSREQTTERPAVAMRNTYPPLVDDMRGDFRMLDLYAWEESGFPQDYVRAFNERLDLITVGSVFSHKVLRDNGVRTPMVITGIGIDHLALDAADAVAGTEAEPDGVFEFLHVSSCFPRKGADVLLQAWGQTFTADDSVRLVIKTFPNPHNTVEQQIADLKLAYPDHAPITLINRDIPEPALVTLLRRAGALVGPSRGEGFGMPFAEAMLAGTPVITTGFGGQVDFCTPDTAILCDYTFAYAQSHLDISDSVWVEPDVASLGQCLRRAWTMPEDERASMTAGARALIQRSYSWTGVAKRNIAAIDTVKALDEGAIRLPKVGMVTTWNSRCGIASYAESLVSAEEFDGITIFADRGSAPLGSDGARVERCWNQDQGETLDDAYAAISAHRLDAVVIQYNFGFFPASAIDSLARRLVADGVDVYLTMHSTAHAEKPVYAVSLPSLRSAFGRLTRVFVHSVDDLNRLKRLALGGQVALTPMGMPQPAPVDRAAVRRELKLGKTSRVIASFGFLLPHKGVRQLIEATAQLVRERHDVHLLLLTALYPAPESADELAACRELIAVHGLEERITLVEDYLDEAEILRRLGVADLIVYPYQHSQESASAAVRLGIASGVPVACTPLAIFDDIRPVAHRFDGVTPAELAGGIARLLGNANALQALRLRQAAWVREHDWLLLSQRLHNIIRGCHIDRLIQQAAARPEQVEMRAAE